MGIAESPKLGFESDIKPLFRDKDRSAMLKAFDLWSHADVVTHSAAIAEQLSNGTMPCDGAWPKDDVARFRRWIEEGSAP